MALNRQRDLMRITEIFFSIQGESTRAGEPCIFVRLTGCSLRCVYCDTKYSYAGGREMTPTEVFSAVAAYPAKLVEITGGEPLEQEEVYPLMTSLIDRGYSVMLETGGHVSVARVPSAVIKIIDIKCPGSDESHKMHWANIDLAAPHDEFKFVISSAQTTSGRKASIPTSFSNGKIPYCFLQLMMICRRQNWPSGFWRTVYQSGFSFRFTNTSGEPMYAGSNPLTFYR